MPGASRSCSPGRWAWSACLYIRLRLGDTPQFAELSKTQQVAESPLREAVSTAWRPILQVIGLMIVFNIGYYVVFTFLPTYFIKTLQFTKTEAFVSITLASLVALILILPLAALSDRVDRRPMLMVGSLAFAVGGYPLFLLLNSGSLAATIVSLFTILTIRETAGRPLPQGRSGRNVPIRTGCPWGCGLGVATELQLGRAAANQPRDAAQVDITRRSNPQPHRPCRRRADACAGRRGNDHRRRAGGQRNE
jgi:hypothetical protein